MLLITITIIIVLASIGLKSEDIKNPSVASDITYTLHTNDNDVYEFEIEKLKSSDEFNQEKYGYVITEIPLNREQSLTLFKDDEVFDDVEIRWTCSNNDKGTSDNLGRYHLWQEGLYTLTLLENFYEENLIYLEIKLEKVSTIYQKMNLYFADNSKSYIAMKQITPETGTIFSGLIWCWYTNDCALEAGDKIYFSSIISITNETYMLNGFKESSMFNEIYDNEYDCYFLLVKETHLFSTILLEYDGAKINIFYEYGN